MGSAYGEPGKQVPLLRWSRLRPGIASCILRKFYLVREVFVFVAFTAFLVFFVASLVVHGIVVQSAGRTVLPASREHDRELLRRAHFVGSSSPARFFHEAHVNVRTDSRLSFALSSSPSC